MRKTALPQPVPSAADGSRRPIRTTPRSPNSRGRVDRAARRRLGRSLAIRRGRRGLVQRLRAGDPRAQQRLLRPGALRHPLRRLAPPRRRAARHRAGAPQHAGGAAGARTRRRRRPKWVVAVGDCAFDGGIFAGSYAVAGGVSAVMPVDLHIRGCPPTPMTAARRPAGAADGLGIHGGHEKSAQKLRWPTFRGNKRLCTSCGGENPLSSSVCDFRYFP